MSSVRKAIIPVAGLGTRFLPATKAQPKQMLPIVDKPIIQYVVEEAVEAGIEEIIFVTSIGKRAIEDHFDYSYELMQKLQEKGKMETLGEIKKISDLASFAYVRQPEALGDGHAVLQARHLVGDEPVAVLFGDDVIAGGKKSGIGELIDVYNKYTDPVIALEQVPMERVSNYGVIDGINLGDSVHEIKTFVEKPKQEEAPSNLAVVGRYVITPEVLDTMINIGPDKSGEIRLAGAFTEMLKTKSLYGCEFTGTRYDCGDKFGFLKATIDFGLNHKEVGPNLKEYLKNICKK